MNSIPIWIAPVDGFSSNGTATHDGGTWIWQYYWYGSISGISGNVDCNYAYANWPGIDTSTNTPSDNTYLAQCTQTSYKKLFTYERWGVFSAWSTTAYTASSTRKVETRTVFKLKSASPSAHSYVNGKCSVCGTVDPDYVATSPDYYLFGHINGANYACEEDYANPGSYKLVDGKLIVTFETDSYVAVKNGNNLDYYMTSGWLGNSATTATLYSTDVLTTADKLYVPGGKEITFTLKVNTNGTLALSYTAVEPVATPTVTPKSPSLTFRDEITQALTSTADFLKTSLAVQFDLGGFTVCIFRRNY